MGRLLLVKEPECSVLARGRSTQALRLCSHNITPRTLPRSGFVLRPNRAPDERPVFGLAVAKRTVANPPDVATEVASRQCPVWFRELTLGLSGDADNARAGPGGLGPEPQ